MRRVTRCRVNHRPVNRPRGVGKLNLVVMVHLKQSQVMQGGILTGGRLGKVKQRQLDLVGWLCTLLRLRHVLGLGYRLWLSLGDGGWLRGVLWKLLRLWRVRGLLRIRLEGKKKDAFLISSLAT